MEVTRKSRGGARGWAWLLLGIGLLGLADQAQFLASNQGMFRSAPGRAGGSVLGLVLWALLAGLVGGTCAGRRGRALRLAVLGVSGVLTVGSALLVVVHAVARVGGLRPLLGAVLSLAALLAAWGLDRNQGFDEGGAPGESGA